MRSQPDLLARTVSATLGAALRGRHISEKDAPAFAASLVDELAPLLRQRNGHGPTIRPATHVRSTASGQRKAVNAGPVDGREPAVPIERSLTRNHLICLEDGRKLRSLTRYLRGRYNLSPEQYRRRWGLPDDYPMMAPALQKLRSRVLSRSKTNLRKKANKSRARA